MSVDLQAERFGLATPFDPLEFVNKLGAKLVVEFEHASEAGTPGLIGAARENPARKQLEKLLQASVAVGSGILIDSFGGRSTQQDIVFYERDFCPVYSINDTPEATYLPIEGVMAAGEVKSVIDKPTLMDALGKIASAKLLRRFSTKEESVPGHPATASFRTFGMAASFAAVQSDEYDQSCKPTDQVYGFIICKSFKHSPEAILDNLSEFAERHGTAHLPNLIVSLQDGFVQHYSASTNVLQRSPLTAEGFAFLPETRRAFTVLVSELRIHAQQARTVPLSSYDRYLAPLRGPYSGATRRPYPQSFWQEGRPQEGGV